MNSSRSLSPDKAAQNWILLGIPVLSIAGCLMHFVYEWSGNLTAVGIFSPVNESVWEHLKLTFWPMLIWWISGYYLLNKRGKISAAQWFSSCTAAELVCPMVIVSFFYSYTGALGIESLILDIFSLFLGIIAAQSFSLHLYKNAEFGNYCLYISITTLALLAAAFTIFTFTPPQLPLFMDS
ncbi:MAG: DUF6512 family protein [Clostridia bacterium]|nr:DUF6512 family protein [Clostridia bacterium]